jgi:hypothetical protein
MKPTSTDTQEVERAISSTEQAADFAALQMAANEADAGPPGAPVGPEAPTIDLGQEIAGLMKVAVATLSPMFPSLKRIYTTEITETAAGAIAAVCNKHGWMQGGMFGEWGEEIACLAIVGPLALSTYQGVSQDMAEAKAKEKPTERLEGPNLSAPAPVAEVGSKTVTFGAPAPAEA